jgi:multidrug efflux pump subunit AcrA (membrane-fusion protein)
VVWVVRPEPEKGMKARKIIVTPGEQKNSMIAITPKDGKIKAGEWVVVQGNERLRPDISVEIIKEFP